MISANGALSGSYDHAEVARSVLIAIAASYAALDLAGRVTATRGWLRMACACAGRVPLADNSGSAVGGYPGVRSRSLCGKPPKMGWAEASTGSLIMGCGIAGMHYVGMAAMRLPAITRHRLWTGGQLRKSSGSTKSSCVRHSRISPA